MYNMQTTHVFISLKATLIEYLAKSFSNKLLSVCICENFQKVKTNTSVKKLGHFRSFGNYKLQKEL